MRKVSVFFALTLLGCGSTGVVPIGNDEFTISEMDIDVRSPGAKVLAKLYVEANEFCAKRNQFVESITEKTVDGHPYVSDASATLRFHCTDEGPADLRPGSTELLESRPR